MAFSDLYEIRVDQVWQSQKCVNVFHVERLEGGFDAGDVFIAMNNWIIPVWRPCVSTSLNFFRIYVWNVSNPEDFFEIFPTTTNGTRSSGDLYVPFGAIGVRFPRLRLDMRHGYKRFPGIGEGDIQGGLLTSSTQTVWNTFMTALVADWEDSGAEHVCSFCIVKRVKYLPEPEGEYAYRLPESAGEYVSYFPSQYVLNTAVTSQNSRKLGRGA